jgi:CubicO group peptidase (beta-lactamase class C family)
VEGGEQPCVQALVLRHGEVAYSGAFGWVNIEEKKPLPQDAIFRIYSMTKVFTSAAMLMLLEEGRYRMYDPLSKYIPEFKDANVVEHDAAGRPQLVPARREIVIRDLFTMASGIPYPGEGSLSEQAMGKVFARFEAQRKKGDPWDTLRMAQEIGKNVPLTFHPGEHWWYGYSIDILGALVCVLSGKPLDVFLKERIIGPLGLEDTDFWVPEGKLNRFVTMYNVTAKGALSPIPRAKDESQFYTPEPFHRGGGGLVSTARDVGRFAQMLLGFGEFEGKRLLSRKSVELMRMNHLTPQQMADYNWNTQRGYGYGLAVRTMLDPAKAGYGTLGEFAWDGMAGTWFSVDPTEDMVCVFLAQTVPGRHEEYPPLFAQAVYGAIAD